jgi:pyrroloquinoline-quinone synthase
MNPDLQQFFTELDRRIAQHDLLCHPFYKAWTAGELTRDELRDYAGQYFHHVAAFPEYLSTFADRLSAGELRSAVLENKDGEQGHDQLWLDFAEAMGGQRCGAPPVAEVSALVNDFDRIAREGASAEVLAAFYAYESQVPGVAKEKARGLRDLYCAGDKACRYFDLHQTADLHHSNVWREQLGKLITGDDADAAERALNAAERAAQSLYHALDGIERERLSRRAA